MIKRIWNKHDEIKKRIGLLNFKLYKYYSIPNGAESFSLINLNNQSVFFSKPLFFNDPFDSNIGADFQESFKAHSKSIMDEKAKRSTIAHIISVAINSKCDNQYILFWKNYVKSSDYIEGVTIYYFDVLKYLLSFNKNKTINKLYKVFGIHDNNEYSLLDYLISEGATKKYLNICIKTNKIGVLTVEDYKGAIASMFRLVNKENNAKEYDSMNEFLRTKKDYFYNAVNELFRISCFCEDPFNVLMWSHYADKHKGFCVEYDLTEIFRKYGYDQLFSPVVYSTKRVSVVLDNVKRKKYKGYDINMVHVLDSLFAKSKVWDYEKEWRKIVLNDNDIADFNDNLCVSKVYLGVNCSKEDSSLIKSICSDKNIPVVELCLDEGFYKLLERKT